jgi:TRAP-type C4-dicarboxylate transport system permease large subunit
MLTKIVAILFLVVILYCLGSALYYTLRVQQPSRKAAKALTWRVTLSLILFALLILSYYAGWITPHPLMPVILSN